MNRYQSPPRILFLTFVVISMVFVAGIAAKTFVLPHVLESKGSITSVRTFDTDMYFVYAGRFDKGADVEFYLYDDSTGDILQSATGQDVCNPCTRSLGVSQPWQKLSVGVEMDRSGGMPTGQRMHKAWAIVRVTGDTDNVAARAEVHYLRDGDVSPSVMELRLGAKAGSTGATKRVYVLPHVLEKSGLVSDSSNTFDFEIQGVSTGGLLGTTASDAAVDLYLYDTDGATMKGGSGADVCNPCSYSWGATQAGSMRKQTIRIDDLITARGGFSTPVKLGFGVLVVSGADPDNIALQGFVVNSHSSAFDLSVFGFDPVPISASSTLRKEVAVPGLARTFSSSPNPTSGGANFNMDLGQDADVSVGIYLLNGQKVATAFSGSLAKGNHRLAWTGMGDNGKVLAPGLYFARLEGPAGAYITRIMKVR